MDRRDFFKTVAITYAAMTIQRSEAMEILTQTINKANGDKPDLVAVMGGEPEAMFRRAISEPGRYEAIHQTRTESSGKAQYRMG